MGAPDLLIFHCDGGVTVLESKSQGAFRDIAAGIGQLHAYAAALPGRLSARQQPKYIRRVLWARMELDQIVPMNAACEAAGVILINAPLASAVRAKLGEI